MTSFKVEKFKFDPANVLAWSAAGKKHSNWPAVYTINAAREIYVGESLNAAGRMRQHLDSGAKAGLETARVILDETFNKSACLDLESMLIRLFSGDGKYKVLNLNQGITDADYYRRSDYQEKFDEIFEALRAEGLFNRTIPQIVNSDLFKFSPFKALNQDQAVAVEGVLEGLFSDLEHGTSSTVVVQGNPGTGKTIVGIYLMKLLQDIRTHDTSEPLDSDSLFSEFFVEGYPTLLEGLRAGIVVPQQSLRESLKKVFKLTPGLDTSMVLTPFDVGKSAEKFDVLIVDEAHRLNQRANQASGMRNKDFATINEILFGQDDPAYTQLDWIRRQSTHQILMLDTEQSVRPADLPLSVTKKLIAEVSAAGRLYPLLSQMRVRADQDYVGYVRRMLSENPPLHREEFGGYDLKYFLSFHEMQRAISNKNSEHGLGRLAAGYAWEWQSRKIKSAFDIEIEGVSLRWNSTDKDWINSKQSAEEVGSIHTLQGYDLNYVGVIIGKDLRYTPERGVYFDRSHYFDKKGMENNPKRGVSYSDEDLLQYVRNIYTVLLTRGIRGTYVYVCDEGLREHLKQFLPG
ncbi:DUF2075 family protein [Leucobacter exalbidus]|uniref:DUF2075 family protein n=1 Tax=Leucobacter exalbidus TaxID=662960 RepID=A0A940PX89_9MICO|nr:DUF2075 domain-containing protein [Leucobacter exalbidus]MBP1325856.1 DUF2075 family protein [Leucobacter exalbidus]